MSEIPTLTQYDSKRAKVRCSLQWVIVQAYSRSEVPKQLRHADIECIFESDGGLKRNIALLLCSADPYCRIAEDVFEVNEGLHSHEEVIQFLCRRGMYVLDDTDFIITAQDLRKMPLDLTSHLAIIDMLMLSSVSIKLAPINSMVYTVRKFSTFSASKELPVNAEEAFILWLNKVSLKVQEIRRNALESDKHTFGQSREDDCDFPTVENVTEDLCDGRSLALVLHYYCPDHFPLQDISLKDPCSLADSWHNLHLSLRFCNEVILPRVSSSIQDSVHPTVLHPVDLLYCGQDLRTNILAFLGSLYCYLEMDALEDVVRPLGHVVVCKRRMTEMITTTEDNQSSSENSVQQKIPHTFQAQHQRTLAEVNQIIPGVQPLISGATKRSFVNSNLSETDSVSVSTMSNSERHNSPVPFSSKPLLVRRNKDVLTTQPSSTSKYYSFERPQVEHFPHLVKQEPNYQGHLGGSYTSSEHTSSIHSARSNPYHNSENGMTSEYDREPVPVVNKWQVRTPVYDIRNTNMSNNATNTGHGVSPRGKRRLPDHPQHTTYDVSASHMSGTSTLLSNVAVDSDGETDEYCVPTQPNGHPVQPDHMPSSVNLNWNGFQHVDQTSTDSRVSNLMRNDMLLETARTSDDTNSLSPRSGTECCTYSSSGNHGTHGTVSDSTTDLTSVSSRTAGSQFSTSNDTNFASESQYSLRESSHHHPQAVRPYPNIVSDEKSPEKPDARQHVVDSSSLHSSHHMESTNLNNPTSQKSYTLHSGAFNTVDSARAAGYPIITDSPDKPHLYPTPANQDPVMSQRSEMRSPSVNRKSRMSSFAENGSGDAGSPLPNGGATQGHPRQMVVNNTVVRLRNPQQRGKRGARSAKATSWVEIGLQQKLTEPPDETRRRHSNLPSREKLAGLRHQLEERRKNIEREKRMKEREWAKELLKIRKEMHAFTIMSQEMKKPQQQTAEKTPHAVKPTRAYHIPSHVTSKNEETSSDYSSKSPSPSSVYAGERAEVEQVTPHQYTPKQIHAGDPISHIRQHDNSEKNYFASPLSSTTYLVNGAQKSHTSINQSYQDNQSTNPDERKTYLVTNNRTHDTGHSLSMPGNEKTYNVSQQNPGAPVHHPTHATGHAARPQYHMEASGLPVNLEPSNRTLTSSQNPTPSRNIIQVDDKILRPIHTTQTNIHGGEGTLVRDQDAFRDVCRQEEQRILHQKQEERLSSPPHRETIAPPDVQVIQASPSEVSTRRSLFPRGNQDPDASAEQENIDPNNLTIEPSALGTYDSFCRLSAGSNHSTPAKNLHNIEEVDTPSKDENEGDMASVLLKTADVDRKGGKGFELVDEGTPNVDHAKKREQFLLKQLKKEEELKRKKAERENQAEKRKEELRVKQEEAAAKKEEEKQKRAQILEEYKKRKMQEEEAQHQQQSSGIISGGKKHPGSASKSDGAQASSKSSKATRSGRSSPASHVSSSSQNTNVKETPPKAPSTVSEKHTTFNVTDNDKGDGKRTKDLKSLKAPAGRKDWDADSASSSAFSSEYSGPKLYKQPSSKSNRNLINNAICHCCLPAKVNETLRNKTMEVLETSDARHLMILFRDAKCQYRALYSYDPDTEKLHKLTGTGPTTILPNMIERLFKYNSGRKSFTPLPSKTLSVSIDAITIKNSLWQNTKKAHPNPPKK